MLEIRILGQFDVRLDGKPVEMRSQPLRLLLAYLALNAGQSIPREKIAGMLWPDTPDSAARKNLRNYVWQLRRLIGDRYLAADRNTLSVTPADPYRIDAAAMRNRRPPGSKSKRSSRQFRHIGESCCRATTTIGCNWSVERLRALFERRMEILLAQLAAQERWSTLVTWSEHWIAYGESPEPAYRSLMIGYAGSGDQAGMATSYRRCKTALRENLSVEPSVVTQMLFERLHAASSPLAKALAARQMSRNPPTTGNPAVLRVAARRCARRIVISLESRTRYRRERFRCLCRRTPTPS